MRDRDLKGRAATGDRSGSRLHPEGRKRGEAVNTAKLTPDLVRALRRDRAELGLSYQELGEKYGVELTNAWAIVKGKTWRHVS